MKWEETLLRPYIEDLQRGYVNTRKEAMRRDALGKSDKEEWYEKASIYEKAARTLEALIPKDEEEHIL